MKRPAKGSERRGSGPGGDPRRPHDRNERAKPIRLGILSDTHGLLRPEAIEALRRCPILLHAGDIGDPEILEALAAHGKIVAVRGNVDRDDWARTIPEARRFRLRGVGFLLVHDGKGIDRAAAGPGIDVVVCGHSHIPRIEERDGLLFVNPGSAGPRPRHLPV
ncbi:MAG: metallophosphoesterase family protein, partial [Candidatus Eisenbacteria bacterium]|nr:metallophosphoesterase family protein [Candidatus Eisenbacteria bacterium]